MGGARKIGERGGAKGLGCKGEDLWEWERFRTRIDKKGIWQRLGGTKGYLKGLGERKTDGSGRIRGIRNNEEICGGEWEGKEWIGPDYTGKMETTGFQGTDPEPLAHRTC